MLLIIIISINKMDSQPVLVVVGFSFAGRMLVKKLLKADLDKKVKILVID